METPPARARNHKPRGADPTCPYRAILISGHTYSWLWISVVHLRRSSVANKQDVLARKRVGLHNSQLAMIRKRTKKTKGFWGLCKVRVAPFIGDLFFELCMHSVNKPASANYATQNLTHSEKLQDLASCIMNEYNPINCFNFLYTTFSIQRKLNVISNIPNPNRYIPYTNNN